MLKKNLDAFIDYRYSLPLDWDNIDRFHDLFKED